MNYFIKLFGCMACRILVPCPGIEPEPPALKVWCLTGKSQSLYFYIQISMSKSRKLKEIHK